MPYFYDQSVEKQAGSGELVIQLEGVQRRGWYQYIYRLLPGYTWPAGFTQGAGSDSQKLTRAAGVATPAGSYYVRWEAVQADGVNVDPDTIAADEPVGSAPPDYQRGVSFSFYAVGTSSFPQPPQLEQFLNGLPWRDTDILRIGVPHSDPRSRYLFMSLPFWAEAGYAPAIPNPGGTPDSTQYMPIENIQELILPEISSKQFPRQLLAGARDGSYVGGLFVPLGEHSRPTQLKVESRGEVTFRSVVRYGDCRMRILWDEGLAMHGGPYGLRQAAMDIGQEASFVYYQRGLEDVSDGKVLLAWDGYVSGFTETVTRRGIIVDVVISPSSGLHFGTAVRRIPPISPVVGRGVQAYYWPRPVTGV